MKRLAALALLSLACTGKYVRPTRSETFPKTNEQIARGQYLVDSVSACGACHTTRPSGQLADGEDAKQYLAGGNALQDDDNFKIYIPNLTSDEQTGLGNWTDDEIARAIRDGVHRDGSIMFPAMPYPSYQHMSDSDVQAIVVYLRTVPKIHQGNPRFDPDIPFIPKIGIKMGFASHTPAQNVTSPDPSNKVAYGKYLVWLGHCDLCHSLGSRGAKAEDDEEYMAGSDKPFDTPGIGKVWAANLTRDPTNGIGNFSDAQVKEALRTGKRLDGKPMAYPMSSFIPHLSTMTDQDLDAIIAYLRTLRPSSKKTPPRELTDEGKKRYGG